jgi:Mce-associated membrane protein
VAAARTARGLTSVPALLLAGVAIVAATVAVLLLSHRLSQESAAAQRRDDILQAARQEGVNVTTLDHRSVDRDIGRVLSGATGNFKKEFSAGTKDLKSLVTTSQAVSVGEVLEAGIVTADSDSARVLVVVDSTVSNTSTTGQVRHYRIQMDLTRSGRRWLTSDLSFVS